MRLLSVVVLVALVLGGAWLVFRSDQETPPAAPENHGAAPTGAPEVGPKPLTGAPPERRPAPAPSSQPTRGFIEYPDGTFYPPLNGVEIAPKPVFHPRMAPFAKVVGIEKDALGRDWYVHENGTRSTVYVNSAGMATYEVSKPVPALPVLDESAEGAPSGPKKPSEPKK